MSLKEKSIKGFSWVVLEQLLSKGLRFGVYILLARWLLPTDFGLMALVFATVEILNTLVGAGMNASLIRSKKLDQVDYSTVFLGNGFSGVVLYLCLFILAPMIAQYFHQPILVLLLRVGGINLLIYPMYSVHLARFTQILAFRTLFMIQSSALILSSLLGLILAYRGWGVWSFIGIMLGQSIVSMFLFWGCSQWRPQWIFHRNKALQHFSFGYKLSLTALVEQGFISLYDFIIGKLYLADTLGFYNRANALQKWIPSLLITAINRVTFPLWSQQQDNPEFIQQMYQSILRYVYLVLTPLIIYMYLVAEPLFEFLLTEKWLPAVPYFKVLCGIALVEPLYSFNLVILKVKGRSDLFLQVEVLKKILFVVGLIFAFPHGIMGLLYYRLIFTGIETALNALFCRPYLSLSLRQQMKHILPPMALALGIAIGLLWVLPQYLLDNVEAFGKVLIWGLVYFSLWGLLTVLLFKQQWLALWQWVRWIRP